MPGRRRSASSGSNSTRTRRTTTRKASPRKATTRKPAPRKAAPELPTAGPGERVWVLAVPFRAPAPGAVWHPGLQAHVWVGAALPPELAPYDPPAYSLERFLVVEGTSPDQIR